MNTTIAVQVYSDRDIGDRPRLEDYAVDERIETPAGLDLQIALVCDGVGGEDKGERASYLAAEKILDTIRTHNSQNIPAILNDAVQNANAAVYGEMQGSGSTTVALIAIHLNDDSAPNGRLYIANVGDSYICVVRDGKLRRINIDHTRANDRVLSGEVAPEDAHTVENGHFLTRAVGVNPDVAVDMGLYSGVIGPGAAEKALSAGLKGMLLKDNDTIFASSDGMFKPVPGTNKAFVRDEEFIHHALDADVRKAVRTLIAYGSARRPDDNISLSMVFIGSNRKDAVVIGTGMTQQQRILIYGAFAALLVVVVGVGLISWVIYRDRQEQLAVAANAQATLTAEVGENVAQIGGLEQNLETVTAQFIALTATAEQANANATATASVPTNTPTPTPLPTERPVVVDDTIAVQYVSGNEGVELNSRLDELGPLRAEMGSYAVVGRIGGEPNAETYEDNAQLFFTQTTGQVTLEDVNDSPNRESIDLLLHPDTSIFVETRRYANGGVQVTMQQNANIRFVVQGPCLGAGYIEPDVVRLTCYADNEGACTYELRRGERQMLQHLQYVDINVTSLSGLLPSPTPPGGEQTPTAMPSPTADPANPVDPSMINTDTSAEAVAFTPIDFASMKAAYDTIQAHGEAPDCLMGPLDPDSDGFLNNPDTNAEGADQCPDDLGEFEGCPDTDGDGRPDHRDACDNTFAPNTSNGCLATATPPAENAANIDISEACPNGIVPDPTDRICGDLDGDGILNGLDNCIGLAVGPVASDSAPGCPTDFQSISINEVTQVPAQQPTVPGPPPPNGQPPAPGLPQVTPPSSP